MAHTRTTQQAFHTGSTSTAPARKVLLVAGALICPPLLMLAVGITLGEGYESLRVLDTVPMVGPAVLGFVRAVVWLYSLDLQVGQMTPLISFNALYLVFAALFARRRSWIPSLIVLVVPLAAFWYVASLLQD